MMLIYFSSLLLVSISGCELWGVRLNLRATVDNPPSHVILPLIEMRAIVPMKHRDDAVCPSNLQFYLTCVTCQSQ